MLIEAQEARTSVGAVAWGRRIGVTRLMLTDFRNYREAKLVLGPEPVVVAGPNGAGKTNLLEAISFLAPGRGLRGVRLTEIARRIEITNRAEIAGTEMDWRSAAACANAAEAAPMPWAVAATIAVRRGALRLGTGCDPADGDRRLVRIDGEPARSQAALGEEIAILWLTPAMDRLFADGPGGRRRFLDRLVLALDPAHAARVSAYEEALRERARLLRAGFSTNRPADPAWLAALEAVMAAQGVAVAAARRETVQRLDHACAASQGPFPRARLVLAGTVEDWLDHMPALAVEAKLADALVVARRGDALTGGAAIGPHRCDLRVTLAQNGIAAAAASTGEQKALLISILLAHAELQRALRGEPPLLLLDEIAAHLDAGRRGALFEILAGFASQVWLSGTDEALFAPLRGRAQFLAVRDGAVTANSL